MTTITVNEATIELRPLSVFIGQHKTGKGSVLRAASAAGHKTEICPENGVHRSGMKELVESLRNRAPIAIKTYCPYLLDFCEPEEVFVCRIVDGIQEIVNLENTEAFKSSMSKPKLGEYWSFIGENGLIERMRHASEESEVKNLRKSVLGVLYKLLSDAGTKHASKNHNTEEYVEFKEIQFFLDAELEGRESPDCSGDRIRMVDPYTEKYFIITYKPDENVVECMGGGDCLTLNLDDPKSLTWEWFENALVGFFITVVEKHLGYTSDLLKRYEDSLKDLTEKGINSGNLRDGFDAAYNDHEEEGY